MRGILATAVGLVMAIALQLGAPPSDMRAGSDDGTMTWQQATPALAEGRVVGTWLDMNTTGVQVPLKDGIVTHTVRLNVRRVNNRAPEVAPTRISPVAYQFPYDRARLAA